MWSSAINPLRSNKMIIRYCGQIGHISRKMSAKPFTEPFSVFLDTLSCNSRSLMGRHLCNLLWSTFTSFLSQRLRLKGGELPVKKQLRWQFWNFTFSFKTTNALMYLQIYLYANRNALPSPIKCKFSLTQTIMCFFTTDNIWDLIVPVWA